MTAPTVLVADDDPAIRRVVRTMLEADGFSVVEAEDGTQAIGMLDRREHLATPTSSCST